MKKNSTVVHCYDCNKKIDIQIDDENKTVKGGHFYFYNDRIFIKCNKCFDEDPILRDFNKCEVYSRVVGFLAQVNQFNPGKRVEYEQRVEFKVPK